MMFKKFLVLSSLMITTVMGSNQEVYIQDLSKNFSSCTISCPSNTSIRALKEMLCNIKGIPVENQSLYVGGKKLLDDEIVETYREYTCIHHKIQQKPTDQIIISFSGLIQKEKEFSWNTTINEVIQHLQNNNELQESNLLLIFNNKIILQNDLGRPLSYYFDPNELHATPSFTMQIHGTKDLCEF